MKMRVFATGKLSNNISSSVLYSLILLLLLMLCTMSFIPQVHQWGDTSTYYMQIQSIAEDQDIQYRPNDIERAIDSKFDNLPVGLFLIKTDEGDYFYGKEYSYALFAAPFYKVFGNNGILLFNALMFYVMILLGYLYLRRENSDQTALGVSIIFFIMSTAFVYIFWIHAEIYNMFLIMSGLFLWTTYINDNDRRYLIFASFVFGIAFVAKVPNILLFIPLLSYEAYNYKFKNVGLMILAFSVVVLVFCGYFYMETGTPSFYGGERLQYNRGIYPFIGEYDNINEAGRAVFSVSGSKIWAIININNLKIIPYNVYYYFFGRFTGVMWYYPFAIYSLVSVFTAFKGIGNAKIDSKRTLILFGIIIYILFFTMIMETNYLGGCHAVGNRYFYIYPAFLFLLGNIKYSRLVLFLIVATITVTPIIANPIWSSERPDVHTFGFPYKYFPFEYSQLSSLPLWATTQRGEIYPIYVIETDKRNKDYLIMTDSEVGSFDLLLCSYYEDNLINLKANNYSDQIVLDKYDAKILTTKNISPEYKDRQGFVYKLSVYSNNNVELKPIDKESWTSNEELLYGPGWHGMENWEGTPTRWMSNNATIFAYSKENRTAKLDLSVISYRCPRNLEIYLNGRPWLLRSDVLTTNFVEIMAPPITLRNGTNIITCYVTEECESPYDVTEGKSSDARCLSLAFQNIKLTRDVLIINGESFSASLSNGWHGIEDWSGTPTRWMENDAIIIIESEENRTEELSFRVLSYNRPRTLEVYDSEDNLIREAAISKNFVEVKMPIDLEVGANSIRLHTPEGCESPNVVTEGKSSDTRCLSMAFQNGEIN